MKVVNTNDMKQYSALWPESDVAWSCSFKWHIDVSLYLKFCQGTVFVRFGKTTVNATFPFFCKLNPKVDSPPFAATVALLRLYSITKTNTKSELWKLMLYKCFVVEHSNICMVQVTHYFLGKGGYVFGGVCLFVDITQKVMNGLGWNFRSGFWVVQWRTD